MADFPGLATTPITTLSANDPFLVADSTNSNRATEIEAENFLIPVPHDTSGSLLGRNHITSPDSNSITNSGNIHTSLIAQSTGSDINVASHTFTALGTVVDTSFVEGSADHSLILGYDNRNNALAGTIISKHGDLWSAADHSSIFGGSNHRIEAGSYATLIGGTGNTISGSSAQSTIIGGTQNTIDGAANAFIGSSIYSSVTGNYSTIIASSSNPGSSIAAVGAAIIGNTAGASVIGSSASGSVVAGGRNNEIQDKAYQLVIGQDTVGRVRAAFTHGTDNISADGDAQNVRWIGKDGGTGTLTLVPSGTADCVFSGYGSTGGFILVETQVVFYDTVTGNRAAYKGEAVIDWVAGGASAIVAGTETWSEILDEIGITPPAFYVHSTGRIGVLKGGFSNVTNGIARFDGTMTHF